MNHSFAPFDSSYRATLSRISVCEEQLFTTNSDLSLSSLHIFLHLRKYHYFVTETHARTHWECPQLANIHHINRRTKSIPPVIPSEKLAVPNQSEFIHNSSRNLFFFFLLLIFFFVLLLAASYRVHDYFKYYCKRKELPLDEKYTLHVQLHTLPTVGTGPRWVCVCVCDATRVQCMFASKVARYHLLGGAALRFLSYYYYSLFSWFFFLKLVLAVAIV